MEAGRCGNPKKIEHGGGNVHQSRGLRYARRMLAGSCGPMDQQRNVQGALIDEIAVARFAMVTEAFAVIGEQNDQRPVPPPALLQRIAQSSHELIDICEFGIISSRT